MEKSKRHPSLLTVYVNLDTRDEIIERATEADCTLSQWLRTIVAKYVKEGAVTKDVPTTERPERHYELTVYVNVETRREIEKRAEEADCTLSQWVRTVLAKETGIPCTPHLYSRGRPKHRGKYGYGKPRR